MQHLPPSLTRNPRETLLPFENPQADAAPTRRSSRLRTAAFAAPAADTTASVSTDSAVASAPISTPRSRRVEREQTTVDSPEIPAAPVDMTVSADAFEQASRAFRASTGPVPTIPDAASATVGDAGIDTSHVAPRRPRNARKFLTIGATVGVMSLAGLLAVSMTLPAEAVAAAQGTSVAATSLVAASASEESKKADGEIQAFIAPSDVQSETLARGDDFSTVSLVEVAAEQGINYSSEIFTNDPEAAIQWPFMVGVGMSYGYGMRSGRLHEGIDFVPGDGAPVQAIADGTVRIATEQGGAYGVTVYIDHVIDGQVITSHYSHMQYGSLEVAAGDTVTVGTVVGKTGNTGRSYGAHMHFELIVNGSTIDPLPWLRENAGRYSY